MNFLVMPLFFLSGALYPLADLPAALAVATRVDPLSYGIDGLRGALIGVFFGILGLFVGPVIGAILGEFVAGKRMIDAGRAGWGSLLGNLGGMVGKLIIALAMITIFLMTVPPPF